MPYCIRFSRPTMLQKSAIERSTTELYVQREHTAGIEPATIRILPWSCRGLNPGLCACKAHDLPLIYNPSVDMLTLISIFKRSIKGSLYPTDHTAHRPDHTQSKQAEERRIHNERREDLRCSMLMIINTCKTR